MFTFRSIWRYPSLVSCKNVLRIFCSPKCGWKDFLLSTMCQETPPCVCKTQAYLPQYCPALMLSMNRFKYTLNIHHWRMKFCRSVAHLLILSFYCQQSDRSILSCFGIAIKKHQCSRIQCRHISMKAHVSKDTCQ